MNKEEKVLHGYEKIMKEIEERIEEYKKGRLDIDVALFDIVDIIDKYKKECWI